MMAWLAFLKEQRGPGKKLKDQWGWWWWGGGKCILMSFSLEGAISQPGGLILGGPEP